MPVFVVHQIYGWGKNLNLIVGRYKVPRFNEAFWKYGLGAHLSARQPSHGWKPELGNKRAISDIQVLGVGY